jgi:hypothetical protein
MKKHTVTIPDTELSKDSTEESIPEEKEIDDFHHFIERTKLQNRILLKLTENLQQKETNESGKKEEKLTSK